MKTIGYFNGEIGELSEMKIPLCDRSVFYGDAIYDAILVLRGKPFALELHLDRLYNSCKLAEIAFNTEREELKKEIDKLLSYCDSDASMLYMQVTRGAAPRKHEYPENATPNLIMYVSPLKLAPKDKKASLMSIDDLRFQYCNIKTVNLMPNVFAAQKATANGYTEALLHRNGRVTEAAHSSILMLKNGALVVPPLDNLILPSITRAVIIKICEENSIPVIAREFSTDELKSADEIILCSTTKNILYVYNIDGIDVGGKDRALAEKLQNLLLDEVARQTGVRL